MLRLILELTLQGYKIHFETNVANERFVAITMSKDGINCRANVAIDNWIKDWYTEKAIYTLKVHVDQRLKGGK